MIEKRGVGSRRPYQKPRLRIISLVADEVLAVGCKLPAAAGPAPGTCLGGVAGPLDMQCFNPGS